MKELTSRRNIRLKGYNYSKEGYYFITVCIKRREQILSKIIKCPTNCNEQNVGVALQGDPKIILTKEGQIIERQINYINEKIENIRITDYVIMPDHIHFIMEIMENGAPKTAPPTIPKIINSFKSIVSKQLGYSIWQRNYYEHIIRNEKEYIKLKKYILENPCRWLEKEM